MVLAFLTSSAQAQDVVVAVVDTGLDFANPAFKSHLWTNPGEVPNNQLDDDRNGFIDDVHGWDFTKSKPLAMDFHGHGSHVSGIILNQLKALPSCSEQVKIMTLKYYDPQRPTETLRHTIEAFRYAVRMGAHIINYSGGGPTPSPNEKTVLQAAAEKGILVVAAAGNEGAFSEQNKFYPAGYGLSHIVSVAALDRNNKLIPSSNFGARDVFIGALGKNVWSWLPQNKQGVMTGTSQATAQVTAAAAHQMCQHPHLQFQFLDAKKYLAAQAQEEKDLLGLVSQGALISSRSLPLADVGQSAFGIRAVNNPSTFTFLNDH